MTKDIAATAVTGVLDRRTRAAGYSGPLSIGRGGMAIPSATAFKPTHPGRATTCRPLIPRGQTFPWRRRDGVSGAGKTAVGTRVAAALACPFLDGDDFHPAANVERMAGGQPLTDADRAPWLDAVAAAIAAHRRAGRSVVVACSALKRRYRERLREGAGELTFIVLAPPVAELRARLAARTGHFMPASLLDSQLAALEPPDPRERAVVLSGALDLAASVERILAVIGSIDRPPPSAPT